MQAALDRLVHLATPLLDTWPFTGAVVTVASGDGTTLTRSFGYADVAGTAPVRDDHLFEIGSISKMFVGLLAATLAEEGVLDLTAPVSRYLPWFAVQTGHPLPNLTHLLHHASGLVKGCDDPPDALAQCWALRRTHTGSAPGTVFGYSNVGYMLLGLVLEAASGHTLHDLVQSRILGPLGMADSAPRTTNAVRSRLAEGSWPARDDQPWCPGQPLAPATWFEVDCADGAISASGRDMGAFLHLLLGQGRARGCHIIPPQAFARAISTLSVGGEEWTRGFSALPVTSSRYGFGINVETAGGHHCLSHGGGMVGYSSFVLADLTAGVAISVLTNANGCYPVAQTLARLGHALLLSPDMAVPTLTLALTADSDGVAAGYDPAMLGTFEARYPDGASQIFTIRVEQDGLRLSTATGEGRLYKTWSSRFATDHPDFRRFHLGFSPEAVWTYGSTTYHPEKRLSPNVPAQLAEAPDAGTRQAADPAYADLAAAVGRYRSFTPWFPTFRLVLRDGTLFLIAPGGIEAPTEDVPLVPLEPGVFRMGREDWVPDHLTFGPKVDGRVIEVMLGDCRFSRTAMD